MTTEIENKTINEIEKNKDNFFYFPDPVEICPHQQQPFTLLSIFGKEYKGVGSISQTFGSNEKSLKSIVAHRSFETLEQAIKYMKMCREKKIIRSQIIVKTFVPFVLTNDASNLSNAEYQFTKVSTIFNDLNRMSKRSAHLKFSNNPIDNENDDQVNVSKISNHESTIPKLTNESEQAEQNENKDDTSTKQFKTSMPKSFFDQRLINEPKLYSIGEFKNGFANQKLQNKNGGNNMIDFSKLLIDCDDFEKYLTGEKDIDIEVESAKKKGKEQEDEKTKEETISSPPLATSLLAVTEINKDICQTPTAWATDKNYWVAQFISFDSNGNKLDEPIIISRGFFKEMKDVETYKDKYFEYYKNQANVNILSSLSIVSNYDLVVIPIDTPHTSWYSRSVSGRVDRINDDYLGKTMDGIRNKDREQQKRFAQLNENDMDMDNLSVHMSSS